MLTDPKVEEPPSTSFAMVLDLSIVVWFHLEFSRILGKKQSFRKWEALTLTIFRWSSHYLSQNSLSCALLLSDILIDRCYFYHHIHIYDISWLSFSELTLVNMVRIQSKVRPPELLKKLEMKVRRLNSDLMSV